MNISYAPYLPADEEGSQTIDNYGRMLDKKYSLEPLIRALKNSERNSMSYEALSSGITRQISVSLCHLSHSGIVCFHSILFLQFRLQEVVILSDDEDDIPPKRQIKTEPKEVNQSFRSNTSNMIDLTEEALDDTDIPRHYIGWLTDLCERAKVQPITVDQRLEVATVLDDVIVIDDDENNKSPEPTASTSTPPIIETAASDLSKVVVQHVDSPSSDSGCVIMTREEVGIQSNSNLDISQCSSDTGVDEDDALTNNAVKRGECVTKSINQPIAMDAESLHTIPGRSSATQTVTMTTASGSKSRCSETAAEQLLTVASQRHPTPTIVAIPSEKEIISNEKRTSIFDTSKSTQATTSGRNLTDSDRESIDSMSSVQLTVQKPIHSYSRRTYGGPHRQPVEVEKRVEATIDEDDDEASAFLQDVFGSKPIRGQALNRSQPPKASSIRVVHPARFSSSETMRDNDDEQLQDLSQRKVHCSVPLSSIRTNNILSRSAGLTIVDVEEQRPAEVISVYPSPLSMPRRSALANKSSTSAPNHERTVRFADDVISNDSYETGEKNASRRRHAGKYDVPNLDETVPSTIQERKTYIKALSSSSAPCEKSTQSSTATTSKQSASKKATVTRNFAVMPTARSPPPSPSHSPVFTSPYSQIPFQSQLNQTQHPTQLPSAHGSMVRDLSPPRNVQPQPYRVFYSGTEIDLGLNDVENPLSDSASTHVAPPKEQIATNLSMQSTSATAATFCESDNNLITSASKQSCSTSSVPLPAAIVHPLGLDISSAKSRIKFVEQLNSATSEVLSIDEHILHVDSIETGDKVMTTGDANNAAELLEIYKKLRNHLEIMGYKPEEEAASSSVCGKRRLVYEDDDLCDVKSQRESGSEDVCDEGDASLPFKKRRKLPVYSDTLQEIKEEDSDSQTPFDLESPTIIPPVQSEIEVMTTAASPPAAHMSAPTPVKPAASQLASTSAAASATPVIEDSQPIAHVECVSYPPTPMLSIANIVEYLPFRAYSTFKTPAPEIAPVRFNIVPQPTMVINNPPNASQSGTNSSTGNNCIETTFNIIPSQAQINANTNSSSTTTSCGAEPDTTFMAPPVQAINSDGASNSFNVASNPATIQYRQTFHPNQQYTTYSIQPHQNANNLPANFDLNMFNLHNYQMNPQNYHNLIQNSRINLQEKQAILLNQQLDANTNSQTTNQHCQQSASIQIQQQQHPQQQQQHQQPQQSSSQSQVISNQSNVMMSSGGEQQQQQHKTNVCIPMNVRASVAAPRTKAARKMVTETSVPVSVAVEKAPKTIRVTRSSNRTTRAQNVNMSEQKSPRRKPNRNK